ncbi:hypothetical protein ACOMHN_063975 [Nucella lapillus]
MASVRLYEIVIVLLELALLLKWTNGHGRLLEPPGRSSMWRLGFSTPPNYNDNALYCGGFSNQYEHNGGKCGICGDPYQGPRENEAGGKFATGTITRKYQQGQIILVTVQVTANHLGWFEFKLCPNNNPLRAATPECLDCHVLQLADGSGSKLYIGSTVGKIDVRLRLPDDVTCSNSFGHDTTSGRSCVGCGNQEEFNGCSDVQILSTNQRPPRLHLSRPSLGLGLNQNSYGLIPSGYGQNQNNYRPTPSGFGQNQNKYGLISGQNQNNYIPTPSSYGQNQNYGLTPSSYGHGLISGSGVHRGGLGLRHGDSADMVIIQDSMVLGQGSPKSSQVTASSSRGQEVRGHQDGLKVAHSSLVANYEKSASLQGNSDSSLDQNLSQKKNSGSSI